MNHADAYFSIGKTHNVCEDYTRSGLIQPVTRFQGSPSEEDSLERPYAIVSDGCSGGRPGGGVVPQDSDFGSRLLTVSAARSLSLFDLIRTDWVIWRALDRVSPPLNSRCLDATLLSAHVRASGDVGVYVSGDGVVVARRRDGQVDVWEIDFKGAPGYLSYLLDPQRLAAYLAGGYGERTVMHNGTIIQVDQISLDDDTGFCWTKLFDPRVYELVMLLSDGVQSFVDSNYKVVPLVEIIPHLVDIRSPNGQFLVRSHKFFLTKTCPKLGWQHNDDFGSAALLLDNPEGPS